MAQDKLQLVQYNVASKRAGLLQIWHFEARTSKMYRYSDVCIDILMLVYRKYHLIFSVAITKVSGN
jgi:hypothetical protein